MISSVSEEAREAQARGEARVTGLSSTNKRMRALRIRELALGFNDETSRNMLALAKELEEQAAIEEAERPDGDDPEASTD